MESQRKFFFPIGVLWMVEGPGDFERGSLPLLKDAAIPFEELSLEKWPAAGRKSILKKLTGASTNQTAVICWRKPFSPPR